MRLALNAVTITLIGFIPTLAAAQDWSGPYGYLGASNISGSQIEIAGGVVQDNANDDLEGDMVNFALGYTLQRGKWVFVGEIGLSTGKISFPGYPTDSIDQIMDAKLRVGYSFGKLLAYGSVGVAKSSRVMQAASGDEVDTTGTTYGFGLDYMVTGKMFVGVEYVHRNLEIAEGTTNFADDSYEQNVNAVGLRVGLQF